MKRQKITMVDPWQITSRGWKAFKTTKSVENFANKYHVNHVYWRAPGNKRILLVDFNHFRECYQEWRATGFQPKTHKTWTTKTTAKKTVARRRTKPSSKKSTTYWKPTRRRTTSNRPKTRYSYGTSMYGKKRTKR